MELCWLFGHRYYVVQEFGGGTRRIACEKCGKSFAMNDNLQALVPWDGDFEEFYRETLGKIIIKPWRHS